MVKMTKECKVAGACAFNLLKKSIIEQGIIMNKETLNENIVRYRGIIVSTDSEAKLKIFYKILFRCALLEKFFDKEIEESEYFDELLEQDDIYLIAYNIFLQKISEENIMSFIENNKHTNEYFVKKVVEDLYEKLFL